MADASDRTIPATPRRREAARQQGGMPTAALLAWVAMMATAILLVPGWSRATTTAAVDFFRQSFTAAIHDHGRPLPEPAALLPVSVVMPTALVVLVTAAAGLLVRFLLDGSPWRLGRAAPDWRRINPLAGCARIFSRQTLTAMVWNAGCLALLVGAALLASKPIAGLVAAADTTADSERWLAAARALLLPLTAAAAAVAAAQWGLARLRFERRIRMTPDELKDELKGLQADPRVRLQREKQPAPHTRTAR